MTNWIERLEEEREQLGERLKKLGYFMRDEKCDELPKKDSDLIFNQFMHMNNYYLIVTERLDRAKKHID